MPCLGVPCLPCKHQGGREEVPIKVLKKKLEFWSQKMHAHYMSYKMVLHHLWISYICTVWGTLYTFFWYTLYRIATSSWQPSPGMKVCLVHHRNIRGCEGWSKSEITSKAAVCHANIMGGESEDLIRVLKPIKGRFWLCKKELRLRITSGS